MNEPAPGLDDPAFRTLLARRSRLRWGLSGVLVGTYLLYVLGGIYLPDVYARSFAGTSIPWGIAFGYLIIFASIALSIFYVRAVNRLTGDGRGNTR